MRQSTRRGRKSSLLLRGNDAQHLVRTVGGTNPTGKLGNRKKARNLRQHLDVLGGILGILGFFDRSEKVMRISEYLNPGLVKLDLRSETKDDLFVEMVQLFVKNGLIQDADEAVHVLEEREEKMSTGVGNGVGSFQLQLCAGIDAGAPGVIDLGGEALAHGGLVEDITAENLGDVDYRVHHLPSFRRYQNGLNTHFCTDVSVEKSINKLTLGALLHGAVVLPENHIL